MSKALRLYSGALARQPAEIMKFFEEMKSDSARGSVATIAALMENQLGEAIKKRLVSLEPEDDQRLFGGTGPLATLSARINIAYALGIFGTRARRDLHLVREIRNAFVHSIRHMDFDTPPVKQLCGTFYCSETVSEFKNKTPREQFFCAANRVIIYATRELSSTSIYLMEVPTEYREEDDELNRTNAATNSKD